MTFIEELTTFLLDKSIPQLIAYFWYFILFDFIRYAIFDVIIVYLHFKGQNKRTREKEKARKALFNERPLISVIAPGKNEGRHIPALAESLKKQTYRNIEIIIVDDGSDDNTPHICRVLQQRGEIDKFFRNEFRGGKASAANLALRYCSGKYIVHLDADSHLRYDSIENLLLPFYLDKQTGAVAGDIRVSNCNDTLSTTLQAIEYLKGISLGRIVSSRFGILRIISGAYGAFRKDILDRIKGWDIGPGLDGDITLRIRKLHYKIAFQYEAICYTNVPDTFKKLAVQRYRWDRSLIRFRLRKHLDLLLPSKNFSLLNFLSSFENILFNVVFNIKWWIYVIHVSIFYTESILYIAAINFLLYFFLNVLEFLMVLTIYWKTLKREEVTLALFLPLMPLYTGIYLRIVRTYAHLMELLFKVSFEDKWNPWKTSKAVKDNDL